MNSHIFYRFNQIKNNKNHCEYLYLEEKIIKINKIFDENLNNIDWLNMCIIKSGYTPKKSIRKAKNLIRNKIFINL